MAADLELTLLRRDGGTYGVDLRLADPASETDRRLSSSAPSASTTKRCAS